MSDEPTLRQAVLDDPDADAPRLDYADWCAQQPDPVTQARAELIRAQIRLTTMSIGAASGLLSSIQALLQAHAAAWAAPIAPFVSAHHFVRGFIEHVELSARQLLDHGAALFAHAPIRHVDLLAIRDVDEGLFTCPQLAKVRTLGLDRLGLYDIHLKLLAASGLFGELRWLSGVDNNFGFDAYVALAKSASLAKLEYADFGRNPVDPVETLGFDGAEVVAAEMPSAGQALEQRFGHLEWLHREHKPGGRYAYG
ncbi:TIGR02996 domain-containing protein [Pseudenhygromyxa sp. WMMC2535]|uniref:TIGR02996 domain-containing protein n=1 Tax=Pseudenhygromyxa sp. WMMC2535 TaxID=2712867 RepID=UPI00155166AB|nr:TIGR02996 domain-containing protein [Pseudenhygromyxa sp. WMMC2535]NVB41978.1 TIGR02996 domain-containing protein [Pseudenhygromyxa sp. WMMC2535]